MRFTPKDFFLNIWISNLLTMSTPDEGYSRNLSCMLKLNIYVSITNDKNFPLRFPFVFSKLLKFFMIEKY